MPKISQGDITVTVEAIEPTAATVAKIKRAVLGSVAVSKMLKKSEHRFFSVEFDEPGRKASAEAEPKRFRAIIYDYTKQHTVIASGKVKEPSDVTLEISARQPFPTEDEFREAVRHVHAGAAFGPGLRAQQMVAARPMPPVLTEDMPDGSVRRYVGVDMLGAGARSTEEIFGVDPADGALLRFNELAPRGSRPPNRATCGAPIDSGQSTADKGTPGRVRVTIKKGAKTIWRFIATRPAASSGTNGSGIELRSVYYLGKRMLGRAHVPILNVKYDNDRCGPYRDWQYQEGAIQATGEDVGATGFRLCQTPATTIMDTGSDSGNHVGVGVYIKGTEVVFVSEMEAGWYRYLSEWRFDMDGTLRPRFGFAAVQNSCVCNLHHHHCYWRFDIDVLTGSGNRVREFNNPPLSGSSNWHDIRFEAARPRDPARKRRWQFVNVAQGAGVEITPGAADGVASTAPDAPFGRGDVWLLRFRESEIDDGVVAVGPPYEANIGQWVNGEAIDDQDIVMWYAGHFSHDLAHDDPAVHGHILGPEIKPINWPS